MEQTPGKGTGKLTLGKGKGKQEGKGKGGRNPPGGPKEPKALEDMPEQEQMVEGLKKLKKTRDLLQSTMTNYDEALEKVKGMNYLAKSALKDKQQQLVCLETTLEKVKKQVAKGDNGRLQAIKDLLKEAVSVIQQAKEEAKELVQISMSTKSQASSKR